jgi:hypothetical protein
MYYLIYKTTNIINGKIYIGAHKTNNIDDGYIGSGIKLNEDIIKYGKNSFKTEILEYLTNSEEMYQREKEIVNEDFIIRVDTYNMIVGGSGGWEYVNDILDTEHYSHSGKLGNKALQERRKDKEWNEKYIDKLRVANKKKFKGIKNSETSFLGKKHTVETKKKISNANKGNGKGENNSQYGTMWINDGIVSKKIKKDDEIPEGFKKGRKMKNK